MNKYFFIITIALFSIQALPQVWVQTSTTPIGGGITDLLVRSNGDILVTVGSFNWPSVAGGVRKSTDDGQTWQNTASAFNGRTIEEAFDGNLYASIWFSPQNEGLYRSTDGGSSWGSPIYSVPSGNNIFSIAAKSGTPNYLLFVGTRNGVMRSTDSGVSFQASNNGLPTNSWVRDLEIDSSGIIAAATTNGLFISTNNGDLWEQATGISASDTIVTLLYDYPLTTEDGGDTRLYMGSQNGFIYESFKNNLYLTATLLTIFGDGEVASIFGAYLLAENKKVNGVAVFPKSGDVGGIYVTNDTGAGFVKENQGLPSNPKVSALSGRVIQTRGGEETELYAGLYENTSNGARIFKRTSVVGVEEVTSEIPASYQLPQNYPNPFNSGTVISWQSPVNSHQVLKIYDILGNEVTTLVDDIKEAGYHSVEFNAAGLSSGVYLYKLQAGTFTETKKMTILK